MEDFIANVDTDRARAVLVCAGCFSGCGAVVFADYPRGGSSRSIPLADIAADLALALIQGGPKPWMADIVRFQRRVMQVTFTFARRWSRSDEKPSFDCHVRPSRSSHRPTSGLVNGRHHVRSCRLVDHVSCPTNPAQGALLEFIVQPGRLLVDID